MGAVPFAENSLDERFWPLALRLHSRQSLPMTRKIIIDT
ncbi:MAG: hypothetical protein ACI90Y_002409, partial [Polaromonas sp.]